MRSRAKHCGAAIWLGIAVVLLASGGRNAAGNGTQSDGSPVEQSPRANGVIFGRLLAGPGASSREAAEPVGVFGQQVNAVDALSGKTVATATTGADGSFHLSVAPGAYLIQAAGNRQYVRVRAGEEAKVNLMVPTP